MEFVRDWLLGVTGAAVLSALAQALMPEGGVKQVGKIVCGLVLIAAVLTPLGRVEVTDFSQFLEYDEQRAQLQEETEAEMKQIIEERLCAYSMDKAQQLGLNPQIQVVCTQEDGVWVPERVVIQKLSGTEGEVLAELLCADFGMTREQIELREGGA